MTRAPLVEHLPPVLREPATDAPGVLERFLEPFEALQREVEREVERIPDLFAVVPAAALAEPASAGVPTLRLDSAGGLRPGDLLELAGATAEFVTVRALHVTWRVGVRVEPGDAAEFPAGTPVSERARLLEATTLDAGGGTRLLALEAAPGALAPGVRFTLGRRTLVVESAVIEEPGELAPRIASLAEPPLRSHDRGTPVRVIGRSIGTSVLDDPARAGDALLRVRGAEGFAPAAGDVLELDVGARREYLRVAGVSVAGVALDTPLRFDHPALASVTRRERAPVATPDPASFPHAPRAGAELVLHASVRRGETWLELDSLAGIRPGDQLRIEDADRAEIAVVTALATDEPPAAALEQGDLVELADADPARIEYVTVAAATPPLVTLAAPLRLSHGAGTPLLVAGPVRFAVALAANAAAGDRTVAVPHAGLGDVLIFAGEHARVTGVRAGAVTLASPLAADHAAGEEITVRAPARRRVTAVLAEAAPAARDELRIAEHAGRTRRAARLQTPLRYGHEAGTALSVLTQPGAGTAFLRFLAGWIGLAPRPDRGERWNRELLRLAGRIWPWRGTPRGLEAFLAVSLRGEAEQVRVLDAPNPLQIGRVGTVGRDAVIGAMPPHYFAVEIHTEPRNSRLYSPVGRREMVQAAHTVLRAERPAHTYYDLRVHAHTMQIGVDAETEIGARVGDTTLLWDAPQVLEGER